MNEEPRPERKKIELFAWLTAALASLGHRAVGRRVKRKQGMCGRLPAWGPTFRYRVTDQPAAVNESDPSWKGHARARRRARAAT